MKSYVNWEEVRHRYIIANTEELQSLADEYNISIHTLRKRAHAGNWSQSRAEYRSEMAKKIREKLVETVSDEYNKFNNLFRRAGGLLLKRAVDYINDNKHLTPTIIDTLANAIRKAQQIMQTSYGKDLPTVEMKIGHQQVINVLNEYRAKLKD